MWKVYPSNMTYCHQLCGNLMTKKIMNEFHYLVYFKSNFADYTDEIIYLLTSLAGQTLTRKRGSGDSMLTQW